MNRNLSGAPRKRWPDAFVHHGARVFVLAGLSGALAALFPPDAGVVVERYAEGTAADRDILAQIPFSVPKDSFVLQAERDAAAAAVIPTFVFRQDAADSALVGLAGFFATVDSAAAEAGTAGISAVLSRAGIGEAGAPQVQLLASRPAARRLYGVAASALRTLVPGGVTAPGALSRVAADSVRVLHDGSPAVVPRNSVLSGREFYDRAVAGRAPGGETDLLRLILARHLVPSLAPDRVRIERERAAARQTVSSVLAEVVEGEAVVRAYQRIGSAEQQRLAAYRAALVAAGVGPGGSRFANLLGGTLLNAMLFGAFGLVMLFYRPEAYHSFRALATVAGIFAVYFLAAFLVETQGLPEAALPISFVAISLAVLWDGRMAVLAVFVLASVTALQPPFSQAHVFATVVAGGAAASLAVRAFRRLAQTWRYIALIALAYTVAVFGLQLRGADLGGGAYLAAALGSAVAGVILSIGFLPVFEWLTGITTAPTLIGWADPNRPLMRRMAEQAPGTFAHSMQVAALAEAGAEAIGAGALLCRAGAYYHDVGKLAQPRCFIENQQGENPHDALEPEQSAAVVRGHVEHGLAMARRHRVPKVVSQFIAEHHGDLTIGSFLQKARARAESEGAPPPDPEAFRYPGPRPQSRETAVMMLADAAESAVRAMEKPTEERIAELVKRIVADRLENGQLDQSGLTLRDVAILRRRFVSVLGGAYHRRIGYAETRQLTEPPSAPPAPASPDAPAPAPSEASAPAPETPAEASSQVSPPPPKRPPA